MTAKPRPVSHLFGPFMVANRKFGKMVPTYFSIGYKTFPVAEAALDVELGDRQERMTATRILAGGLLLGPAGMILGGLATKDVTKGRMTLTVNGEEIQAYEFPGRDIHKAVAFVQALADAQGIDPKPVATPRTPTPPPPPPTPAAWAPDPGKAHELRWWDGVRWTEHVSDNGQQSIDPLR